MTTYDSKTAGRAPQAPRVSSTSLVLVALALLPALLAGCAREALPPKEARAIAKEAYIYGYPMVDNYRIMYAYFVDSTNAEFKAPFNQIHNMSRVYTPEDKAVQTPNSDTPYSMLGLDLRAEPIVLTLPAVPKDRYYSVQLIDLYTHNFAYLGSRTTGNDPGSYMVAGPDWRGETPPGIKQVLRCETQFALAAYRTQLFNPGDIENVKKIQAGYKVEPLSQFLHEPVRPVAPRILFLKPLTPEEQRSSTKVFDVLAFVLQFCPVDSSETAVRARFARIEIEPGEGFELDELSPRAQEGVSQGIPDAWKDYETLKKRIDAGEVRSGDLFGTRQFLKNNYLYRMAAAIMGIYGNSKEEAMYPMYAEDADGQTLDGTANRYTLRFAADQLPPVNAFWSVTMYGLPASLLVENPIHRYLINSPMLPQLKRDPDGGITIHVQHDSPGPGLESNWLPAPAGPFMLAMRLYWPKPEALDGTWKQPPLTRIKA